MASRSEQLEERLIDFGASVCLVIRRLPKDLPGIHVSKQLVRCSTSPAANYAEARGSESRRDFAHKLHICLKELRETSVWLRFICRIQLEQALAAELRECDELISIFVKSLCTTKASLDRPG